MKYRDKTFQLAFGQHVKKFRDERGWSQAQLAAVSGLDANQISRIENGRHAANLHTIRALAAALGKYPDELLRFPFNHKLNTDFHPLHTKTSRPNTTRRVNDLANSPFLDTPRTVAQIVAQDKEKYRIALKSSAVSGVLGKLVQERKIKRIPSPETKGRYLYQRRKK